MALERVRPGVVRATGSRRIETSQPTNQTTNQTTQRKSAAEQIKSANIARGLDDPNSVSSQIKNRNIAAREPQFIGAKPSSPSGEKTNKSSQPAKVEEVPTYTPEELTDAVNQATTDTTPERVNYDDMLVKMVSQMQGDNQSLVEAYKESIQGNAELQAAREADDALIEQIESLQNERIRLADKTREEFSGVESDAYVQAKIRERTQNLDEQLAELSLRRSVTLRDRQGLEDEARTLFQLEQQEKQQQMQNQWQMIGFLQQQRAFSFQVDQANRSFDLQQEQFEFQKSEAETTRRLQQEDRALANYYKELDIYGKYVIANLPPQKQSEVMSKMLAAGPGKSLLDLGDGNFGIYDENNPDDVQFINYSYEDNTGYVPGIGDGNVSAYGTKANPFGLDVTGKIGDPILASFNGTVVDIQKSNEGYGNYVTLRDDSNGYTVRYAHLNDIGVEVGDQVFEGQMFSTIGNTGTVWTRGQDGNYRPVTEAERAAGKGAHTDITLFDAMGNEYDAYQVEHYLKNPGMYFEEESEALDYTKDYYLMQARNGMLKTAGERDDAMAAAAAGGRQDELNNAYDKQQQSKESVAVQKQMRFIEGQYKKEPMIGNIVEAQNGFINIINGADQKNSAGDLSILYGYAKILDPKSAVKEGEFQSVERAQVWFQRYGVQLERAFGADKRLSDDFRQDIVESSVSLYLMKKAAYDKVAQSYRMRAISEGGKDDFIQDYSIPSHLAEIISDMGVSITNYESNEFIPEDIDEILESQFYNQDPLVEGAVNPADIEDIIYDVINQ